MKSIFLFITCFVVISCNPDTNDNQVQQDFRLTAPNFSIDNPKIISAIKEYIANNSNSPSRIYTMVVSRENLFTTSFQLSAIATYSELNELIPFGYFMVDDDVVLVYTGLERLHKKDEIFIKQLKGIIGDKLEDDLLQDGKTTNPEHRGMIFDPSTWEVKMIRDSIAIERGVFNSIGPPVVEVIKFLPPKVK